ncbi:MAG: methyltransferase [Thermoleophilia bacterium]
MSSLVDRREVEKLLLLAAALRSGLVDAIAVPGGRTPNEVARVVDGDLRACTVMLDALVDVGVAEHVAAKGAAQGAGAYRLTDLGRAHLIEPPPGTAPPAELERSSLLHQAHKFEGWLRLTDIVKGSGASLAETPQTEGAAALGAPRRSPARLRAFVRTMGEGDPAVPEEVVSRCLDYAGPGIQEMIDVGGAVGHMARLFADRGVRATLFDRPEVLPEAREFLGARAEGIAMVGGDFTESLPGGPFDLAYLGNVYHIYGPATLAALTRRVFASLRPGGVLCIRDFVWERSPRAAMFAVNMLQATEEGGAWREAEYRGWLEDAGFADVRIVDLELARNELILGRKPADEV